MKYTCTIIDVSDDEITVLINNTDITGFSNKGILADVGTEIEVEISFFDDLKISKSNQRKPHIWKRGDSLSYSIIGILNVEKARIESLIDFDLDCDDLYDCAFLDGKMVEIEVARIDLEFPGCGIDSEANMKKIKLRVRKETRQCLKCGKEKEFLFISDFAYGKSLVVYGEGKRYAYINFLEDSVYNEFVTLVNEIITANSEKNTKSIPMQKLFSVACDPISNFPIRFEEQERCNDCNSCQFESLMIKPIEFIDVEVSVITHEYWKCLDYAQKRKKIEEELRSRYERFIYTLNQCGLFLLNATDDEIETCIFENFYTGIRSNMCDDLELFILEGWIDEEIKEKCRILISLFLDIKIKQQQIWNIQSVKTSGKWLDIMKLADEIKAMLHR